VVPFSPLDAPASVFNTEAALPIPASSHFHSSSNRRVQHSCLIAFSDRLQVAFDHAGIEPDVSRGRASMRD